MVVDDAEDIIKSVGMRLKAEGYEVVSATDGLQATYVAVKERPDVIILDIGMPAGDGHLVAKRLRDSVRTTTIPIIFLTARTGEEDFHKAYEEGVSKYITKPFDPNELMAAVAELVASVGRAQSRT